MGKLAKSAIIVAVLMIISKILGLIREILLANYFGTSYIVDAYSVACTLPSVLFALFASGFATSYIPVISRIKDENNINHFFSNTTCLLTGISFALCLFCFAFSNVICKVFAPGFDGEVAQLTEFFIKCIGFYLPPFTVFNIFCAQSAFDEDFIFCNFCDFVVVNCVVIASIFVAYKTDPSALVYGYVIAMTFATIILGVRLWKRGHKIALIFNYKDINFINLAKLAIPIGFSSLVNQINALVDKMFSSTLGEGVISSLGYANRLQLLPYSLIVSIFVSVCNPRMNKNFADGKIDQGIYYARKALLIAIYISMPLVMLLFFNSVPITELIFKRGQFGSMSTIMTANCLEYYALGILFYAVRQIATSVLVANLKQKLILKNTLISVILNILLNFVLIRHMGYKGLALSTSVAGFVAATLMLQDLRLLNLKLFVFEQIKDCFKIIGSSITATVFCSVLFNEIYALTVSNNLAIVLAIFLAVIAYMAISILLDIDIVIWLYKRIPQRLQFISKWNRKDKIYELS